MKIGIAGAGILGLMLAYRMFEKQHQVTLFDQGLEQNASLCAAGMLSPISELEKCDRIVFDLGQDSLNQHWPQWLTKIKEPIRFKKLGTLVLAHPQDKSERTRLLELITPKIPEVNFIQRLNQKEIATLEPELAHFAEADYFAEEGQIDNQHFCKILKTFLISKISYYDATPVHNTAAHTISLHSGEMQHFDWVLDCRGLGAKSLFPRLRGLRGELLWVEAPQVHIQRLVRLIHPRYSLYLVPRDQSQYILGATEIESEDDSPLSVYSALELLSALYSIQRKFSEARIIKTVTGLRPTLPDHLPAIVYQTGLIAINGLYRHGILIAPTLVEEVCQFLDQKELKYPTLWSMYDRN